MSPMRCNFLIGVWNNTVLKCPNCLHLNKWHLDVFQWFLLIIFQHYSDAIMSAMASQITCVSIVCSIVCSGADQTKHQSTASLACVRGIHRWPLDSPHKVPVKRKLFPFDDVIMIWSGHGSVSIIQSQSIILTSDNEHDAISCNKPTAIKTNKKTKCHLLVLCPRRYDISNAKTRHMLPRSNDPHAISSRLIVIYTVSRGLN